MIESDDILKTNTIDIEKKIKDRQGNSRLYSKTPTRGAVAAAVKVKVKDIHRAMNTLRLNRTPEKITPKDMEYTETHAPSDASSMIIFQDKSPMI